MEPAKRMRDRAAALRAAAENVVTVSAKDALLETAAALEKRADDQEAWLQQIGGGR
jgi:hypothetical protein